MSFSVPPSRVPTRSPVPVVGMVALTALILGAGIFGRVASPAAPGSPRPAVSPARASRPAVSAPGVAVPLHSAAALPPASDGSGQVAAPPGTDRLIPAEMPPVSTCDGGSAAWCQQLLRAALVAMMNGGASDADVRSVDSASVWHSLVCDVPLDCPRDRLVHSTPVGSVVLAFVDGGPRAWINVVRPAAPPSGSMSLTLEAWVARWG